MKINVSPENWIDDPCDVIVSGGGDAGATVRKSGRDQTIVGARFHAIGARSRDNRPAWHVYVNGERNPDITIHFDQQSGVMIASSGDVERGAKLPNLAHAAALAAWKVVQNIY